MDALRIIIFIELLIGASAGFAYWIDSDVFTNPFIHDWIIKRYKQRNWFGAITFSLFLISLLPFFLALEIMQLIGKGISFIIDLGMKW